MTPSATTTLIGQPFGSDTPRARPGARSPSGRCGYGDDLAVIATGSEVSLASDTPKQLEAAGISARVVSRPSGEWPASAALSYRDSVLPPGLGARVVVEVGGGDGWWKYVGASGEVIGLETFGESGSGAEIMELREITVANVMAAAREAYRSKLGADRARKGRNHQVPALPVAARSG